MIKKEFFKTKRSYIRPEAEAVWMESEDLMDLSAGVPDQPWIKPPTSAKSNHFGQISIEDEPQEDDSWGVYFDCDYEE